MKARKEFFLAVFLFVTMITVVTPADAGAIVRVDGSSTVYPITEAVAEEFQKAKIGKVQVTVGVSGTGGGFKKFCRGEIDLSDASRPIKTSEREACQAQGIQYIELPVAYDAISVVVHPENPLANITVAELKKIWEPAAQNMTMKWNQVNPAWSSADLKLYGPGADSGTFDYFTEVVVGQAAASRGDYTASEDDNVLVQGISTDKNAIGYFGFAYYETNKTRLKALAVDGGQGPVLPSGETVKNGTYTPLSRPVFIYVNKASLQKPEVKEFVEFYLTKAVQLVPEVQYVALSEAAYQLAQKRLQEQKVGTVYANHSGVSVTVEELLKREPSL